MDWDDLAYSKFIALPPEAHGNVSDVNGPFDPDNSWLERADRDDQLTAMREWFLARFCDPVHNTPYNGGKVAIYSSMIGHTIRRMNYLFASLALSAPM